METKCECIPIGSIESTAFVYQDYDDEDMTSKTDYVIQVRPFTEWASVYETDLNRRIPF